MTAENLLWTMTKRAESRRAELRDNREAGVEVHIFVNGEFAKGRRFGNRVLGMIRADAIRRALEGSG